MTGLLIPDNRIGDLIAEVPVLKNRLTGSALVAVSGAMYAKPDGQDKARFAAALQTAAASAQAGVPHVFMLDDLSPEGVAHGLRAAGGIVVPVRHSTEGGLARPYITAARIIDLVAPKALMVKVEAEKNLFAASTNTQMLLEAGERFDVITGIRNDETLDTMPDYLRLTEAFLAIATRDLTGTFDAASGVIALTAKGRNILVYTTIDPAWQYLITTPHMARLKGVRTCEVTIGFEYHPDVVAEERRNPESDAKRRTQLALLLDCAIKTAGGPNSLNTMQRQTVSSVRSALAALERLAA